MTLLIVLILLIAVFGIGSVIEGALWAMFIVAALLAGAVFLAMRAFGNKGSRTGSAV